MKQPFLKRRTSLIMSLMMVAASTQLTVLGNEGAPSEDKAVEILTNDQAMNTPAYSALVLTPGSTQYDVNFAWYSPVEAGNQSYVRIIKDGKIVMTQEGTITDVTGTYANAEAVSNKVTLEGLMSHKVNVTGLDAKTTYTYQISNNGTEWSEAYTYETKAEGSFKFAVVGDPQIKEGQYDQGNPEITLPESWRRTLQAIEEKDVNFIVNVGDHIEGKKIDGAYKTNELEYEGFFSAEQLTSIPYAPTLGNHDINYGFKYHFNIPNEKEYEIIETFNNTNDEERLEMEAAGNYFYKYNDALFVMLNDSAYPCDSPSNYEAGLPVAEAFVNEFEKTLEMATTTYPDYEWLFVQHHKSTRTAAQHTCDYDIQSFVEAGFEKLMDEYDVDFVFGGHDHVYTRSHALKDGKIVDNGEDVLVNPDGTVYFTFTSCTGKEFYDIYSAKAKVNENFPLLQDGSRGDENFKAGVLPYGINVAIQNGQSQYSVVEVTDGEVIIETYNQDDGALIDTFSIKKTKAEASTIELNVPTEKVNEVVEFTDLDCMDWAKESIEKLATLGIVNGVDENKFMPRALIKRGDFIRMLTKTMGIKAEAVDAAKAFGIVTGTGENKFSPEGTISRQEAMCILARALELVNLLPESHTALLGQFEDAAQVAAYAKEDVSKLLALGVVKGDGQTLAPTREMTRAEMAVLIDRAYELFLSVSSK